MRARDILSSYIYFPIVRPLWKSSFRRALKSYRYKSDLMRAPRNEIEKLQSARLKDLLGFCWRSNKFYSERLRLAGLRDEADFRLENLPKLPPLTKDVIRANFDAMLSRDIPRTTWYENYSGGSTGLPITLMQDEVYKVEGLATTYVSDCMQGWHLGARQALLWGSPKDMGRIRKLKGRVSAYLYNENLYDSFDMGPERMQLFHGGMTRFKPDVIIAYASSIYLFARFLLESDQKPSYPSSSIISSAETLTESMRESILDCFNVAVYNRYGSREVGNIASECGMHTGLHLHMLDVYLETVDLETGDPVWDRPGRILVTLLTNYAMPLIRYDIGDIGTLTREQCPCGRNTILLKKVLGRSTDFIVSPSGRLIHGEYFTHAFYGHRGIRQFQFVQETPTCYIVRIVKSPEYLPAELAKIKEEIVAVLGPQAEIRFEFPETIAPTATGKYMFTVSKVPITLHETHETTA